MSPQVESAVESKSAPEPTPAPAEEYDRLYKFGIYRLLWHTPQALSEIADAIGQAAKKTGRALELGCGAASHAIDLAKKGYEVTALDFSPTAMAIAAKRAAQAGVSLRLVCADACEPLTNCGTFDVIMDRECLSDLITEEQRRGYARNVMSLLSPGGTYVISARILPPSQTEAQVLIPQLDEGTLMAMFPELELENVVRIHGKGGGFITRFAARDLEYGVYTFRKPITPRQRS